MEFEIPSGEVPLRMDFEIPSGEVPLRMELEIPSGEVPVRMDFEIPSGVVSLRMEFEIPSGEVPLRMELGAFVRGGCVSGCDWRLPSGVPLLGMELQPTVQRAACSAWKCGLSPGEVPSRIGFPRHMRKGASRAGIGGGRPRDSAPGWHW